MALGVPNGGAFGGAAPQPPAGSALRPPGTPTQANMGMNRMPAAWNRGLGAIRPDRHGAMNGERAVARGGFPLQRPTAQTNPAMHRPQFAMQQRPQMNMQPQMSAMPMQMPQFAMNAANQQQQRMGPLPPPGAMPNMPLSLESLGIVRPPPRYGNRGK